MNNFTEALKEGARVLVLAVIPLIIDSLSKNSIDWRIIGITGAIAVLRFIDSWLHNNAPDGKSGGLTQF